MLTDGKTYDGAHYSVIFGATSMNDAEPTISIWSRRRDNAEASIDRPLGMRLKNFLRGIVQLALAIALTAYVSNIVCIY
jgi:hypothetical protein